MPESMVYLQGRLVPSSQASVSIRDRSFRYGEAAFETLRGRGQRAFRSIAHLERLAASAEAFGWKLPWPRSELEEALRETLAANALPESRVRIHASPGPGDLDTLEQEPLLLIEVRPFVRFPEEARRQGVTLAVHPHRRASGSVLAGAKTAAYLENLWARRLARQAGAHDAVILNTDGAVCESSCANLFLVQDGKVRTPALACGVLAGITRQTVLDLAVSRGGVIQEASVTLDELLSAEEVFLTSTGVEVLSVVSVDSRSIGAGVPGPVARELRGLYTQRLFDEIGSPR